MQQGLKQLTEDQVYRLGMDDAQHQDFNVTGVLMAVSLALGVLIGVMI
jgi:hypothetical protein